MTMAQPRTRTKLTVAGRDLSWLMAILQSGQDSFSMTLAHMGHPVTKLAIPAATEHECAIVQLEPEDSVLDVRDLLDRSRNVSFVFVADALPVRHAVARVIRERGQVVVSLRDAPFVIIATATALMAAHRNANG
jgi:hypothetical protein